MCTPRCHDLRYRTCRQDRKYIICDLLSQIHVRYMYMQVGYRKSQYVYYLDSCTVCRQDRKSQYCIHLDACTVPTQYIPYMNLGVYTYCDFHVRYLHTVHESRCIHIVTFCPTYMYRTCTSRCMTYCDFLSYTYMYIPYMNLGSIQIVTFCPTPTYMYMNLGVGHIVTISVLPTYMYMNLGSIHIVTFCPTPTYMYGMYIQVQDIL